MKTTKYFKARIKSVNSEKFSAQVVISDETKDRYDERVLVSSFKKTKKEFLKHGVLLSSHAYRGLMNQIGYFEKLSIDEANKEVVGEVKWLVGMGNPEADWGWKLAELGIAAFSIGFIPKVWKNFDEEERIKNGGVWREYEEIELLEVSQVLVPANPSALQKSFGDDDEIHEFVMSLYEEHKEFFEKGEEMKMEIENKKWEETENEIRFRVREPDQFSEFRYIKIKKDKPRVNAVYGKLKEKDEWKIQALRFPKEDGWVMSDAKSWVKDHPDLMKTVEDSEIVFMVAEEEELKQEAEQPVLEEIQLDAGVIEFLMECLHVLDTRLKEMESKTITKEIESDTIDISSEIADTTEEALGEEKMDELVAEFKKAFHSEPSLEDVKALFDEMNTELKAKFSAQS